MSNKLPQIPSSVVDRNLRRWLQAASNRINQAVTAKDIFASLTGSQKESVSDLLLGRLLPTQTGFNEIGVYDPRSDQRTPAAPENVVVFGIIETIMIRWAAVTGANNVAHTEVWRSAAGETVGDAIFIGVANGRIFTDSVSPNSDYLYYIRHVSYLSAYSPWHDLEGTQGDTSLIVTSDLADDIITPAQIAAGAIKEVAIDDAAVTSEKIAVDAVTANKIAANAITADKIAANAITTTKLAANVITADKIASNAIETSHIKAGAILAENIATNEATIADAIIGDGHIDNAKIGNTIQSTSFTSSTGWQILKSGSAIFRNITAKGHIDATSGTFAGSLSAATGTFKGALSAATGSFNGAVTATSIATPGFKVDSSGRMYAGGTSYSNAKFKVDANGNMYATSGTFSGSVNASDIIGNFGKRYVKSVSTSGGGGNGSPYNELDSNNEYVRGRYTSLSKPTGGSITSVAVNFSVIVTLQCPSYSFGSSGGSAAHVNYRIDGYVNGSRCGSIQQPRYYPGGTSSWIENASFNGVVTSNLSNFEVEVRVTAVQVGSTGSGGSTGKLKVTHSSAHISVQR